MWLLCETCIHTEELGKKVQVYDLLLLICYRRMIDGLKKSYNLNCSFRSSFRLSRFHVYFVDILCTELMLTANKLPLQSLQNNYTNLHTSKHYKYVSSHKY